MFMADAHCDTLSLIACGHMPPEKCTVTPERLRAGGVGLQTFALFAGSRGTQGTPYQNGIDMLRAAETLDIRFFTGALPDTPPEPACGVFSIEGGEMLEGKLERLYELNARARLRLIALTWNYENEIACPAKISSTVGLTEFGRELIREMDALGIYADASHLGEAGFWEICERMSLAPVASHSNARALCDCFRNLSDAQIRAIIEKRGFIGINFYPYFLNGTSVATIDDVVAHIDYIAEMGGIDCLGFGSDFDGIECCPRGLETPADFPALTEALERRGYSREHIEGIAGLNYYKLLKRAELS